jgi:hypothetical protein
MALIWRNRSCVRQVNQRQLALTEVNWRKASTASREHPGTSGMRDEADFARRRVAFWRKPITHRLEAGIHRDDPFEKEHPRAHSALLSLSSAALRRAYQRRATISPEPRLAERCPEKLFSGELFLSIARCAKGAVPGFHICFFEQLDKGIDQVDPVDISRRAHVFSG